MLEETKILYIIKNKLIELGYIVDDGSMKIRSTANRAYVIPGEGYPEGYGIKPAYICCFTVNDDYTIHVAIELHNMRVLHCKLWIQTSYFFRDNTFDILLYEES